MTDFDPNAPAGADSGVFGLPHTRADALIHLFACPFDATASYRRTSAAGPEAIRKASEQVDLQDLQFGSTYEKGIWWEDADESRIAVAREAAARVARLRAQGGAAAGGDLLREADALCQTYHEVVQDDVMKTLRAHKCPGVVGGEHSLAFGAIAACAAYFGEIGVLQIDAHMDLRAAYEGFAWSHASVMYNVLERVPDVSRLVQVGIRDVGSDEVDHATASSGRVATHYDIDWARAIDAGKSFALLCQEAFDSLPELVYVSFDIDGLDPALCPNTGTPVPGGLSFSQACLLLECLVASGRRVVGFDLSEVGVGTEIDAIVGARVLYKLCGVVANAGVA